MIKKISSPKATVALCLALSACGESLVFTEKTGLNIAVGIDAAQGSPVETNLGLHRRVAGLVPPIRRDQDGNSDGEAANMVGGFQVVQDPDASDVFNTTVRVASGYATGPAALALVGELPNANQSRQIQPTGDSPAATEIKNEDQAVAAVTSVMRPAQAAKQAANAQQVQKNCVEQGGTYTRETNDGKVVEKCAN